MVPFLLSEHLYSAVYLTEVTVLHIPPGTPTLSNVFTKHTHIYTHCDVLCCKTKAVLIKDGRPV